MTGGAVFICKVSQVGLSSLTPSLRMYESARYHVGLKHRRRALKALRCLVPIEADVHVPEEHLPDVQPLQVHFLDFDLVFVPHEREQITCLPVVVLDHLATRRHCPVDDILFPFVSVASWGVVPGSKVRPPWENRVAVHQLMLDARHVPLDEVHFCVDVAMEETVKVIVAKRSGAINEHSEAVRCVDREVFDAMLVQPPRVEALLFIICIRPPRRARAWCCWPRTWGACFSYIPINETRDAERS
jgi:hypothetical protein